MRENTDIIKLSVTNRIVFMRQVYAMQATIYQIQWIGGRGVVGEQFENTPM